VHRHALIGAKCDDGPAAIYLYSGGWKETLVIRFDDFWIRRCSSLEAGAKKGTRGGAAGGPLKGDNLEEMDGDHHTEII
jgi:hypothetical protein